MAVDRRAGPSTKSIYQPEWHNSQSVEILTALGATPGTGERGLVDVELRLAEAASADGSTRVRDLLKGGLRAGEHVDEAAQRGVLARGELVDECLEDEGRVTGPGEEVVRVRVARTGDYDTGL